MRQYLQINSRLSIGRFLILDVKQKLFFLQSL